jgi:hypothetical protein
MKVIIFFEELGIPYESDYIDFGDLKKEAYTKINPNGRLPAIHDPNTGITLWEVSGSRIAIRIMHMRLTLLVWRHHRVSPRYI